MYLIGYRLFKYQFEIKLIKMSADFQLREVFNSEVVSFISTSIKNVYSSFNSLEFENQIISKLDVLSFKSRSDLISQMLENFLPTDFPKAASILVESIGPELPISDLSGYDGFYIMPLTRFIARHGMNYFEISMNALYEMTKRFSSEWAIRSFFREYTDQTISLMMTWTIDKNAHVRRLVSEGSRPRLPLASPLKMFQSDPKPVIALLEQLKGDPELYVRRSVANNLNDISKDNPDIVITTLIQWNQNIDSNIQWLTRYALRWLIKQGNSDALALLGYSAPEIELVHFRVKRKNILFGEKVEFYLKIKSQSSTKQNLMIDYKLHFMKANGKHRPKVFKLSKRGIEPNETIEWTKTHSFKDLSTRKHYRGVHFIEIMINGTLFGKIEVIIE